jgi:glycosyltransferase 2 family protein
MQNKRILPSIIFFLVGVALFWYVYRNFRFSEFISALKNVRFGWVIVSIGLGLLSHFVRALRWKMLINTMGYTPRTTNLFLSVIILYFTNLIIPRGGELSRCLVITKYEKVPFVKLVGTVFLERITDLFAFLLIFLILVIWQFNFFKTVMSYTGIKIDFSILYLKLFPFLIISVCIALLVFAMVKFRIFDKIFLKLKRIKGEFMEGIVVIMHLKEKLKYFLSTFIILALWFLMLDVMFFAYPPTDKLTLIAAILTYTFGTFAYLLPIQAGIGTWHFIVINCLLFYGIDKESGMIFALIAHTFTNLIFIIFGPIALALLPVVNSKASKINDNEKSLKGSEILFPEGME